MIMDVLQGNSLNEQPQLPKTPNLDLAIITSDNACNAYDMKLKATPNKTYEFDVSTNYIGTLEGNSLNEEAQLPYVLRKKTVNIDSTIIDSDNACNAYDMKLKSTPKTFEFVDSSNNMMKKSSYPNSKENSTAERKLRSRYI